MSLFYHWITYVTISMIFAMFNNILEEEEIKGFNLVRSYLAHQSNISLTQVSRLLPV